MYRITTKDGAAILTENPVWIRKHPAPGVYLMCKQEKAEGVSHHGTPYLFEEGHSIQEFDGAEELVRMNANSTAMEEHLAETDEIAIDLYEASLAQEAINAEQDEAIIEIYEKLEG